MVHSLVAKLASTMLMLTARHFDLFIKCLKHLLPSKRRPGNGYSVVNDARGLKYLASASLAPKSLDKSNCHVFSNLVQLAS